MIAGKVLDFLLSVAEEQALLPERQTKANIKAKDDLHWIDLMQTHLKFEFQFLVLARDQTRVAQAIRTQLKKFVSKGIGFYPTEILIYSTSSGGTVGELVSQKYEAGNRAHEAEVPKGFFRDEEEKKQNA